MVKSIQRSFRKIFNHHDHRDDRQHHFLNKNLSSTDNHSLHIVVDEAHTLGLDDIPSVAIQAALPTSTSSASSYLNPITSVADPSLLPPTTLSSTLLPSANLHKTLLIDVSYSVSLLFTLPSFHFPSFRNHC